MSIAVDRVLATRRLATRRSVKGAVVTSVLLHGGFVAAVLLAPLLHRDDTPAMKVVPVMMMPLQALGVRNPDPVPPRSEPAPRPAAPAPEPPRERTPEPREEPRPTLPSPERERERAPRAEPQPTTPAPTGAAPAGGDLRRRRGSPTGSSLGTATMGGVSFGDPNFRHSYYADQLTAMLSEAWQRPAIGGEVTALVSFRVARDGSVSDVRIAESSGYSSFDLAALRAVHQAAPFPPLPQAFKDPSVVVVVEFI